LTSHLAVSELFQELKLLEIIVFVISKSFIHFLVKMFSLRDMTAAESTLTIFACFKDGHGAVMKSTYLLPEGAQPLLV